jgi:hypothetical protein
MISYCQALLKTFFKTAFLGQTDQKSPLFFGGLFSQYLRAALRAITGDRFIPGGKLAFRVSAAAVKCFTAL